MPHPTGDTREALRDIDAMRARLESAENAGDAEVFVEMMADDIVLMVPDQPVQTGKPACAAFVRNVLSGILGRFERRISYVSDEVAALGEVAAFDRGTFSFTVTPREGGMTTRVTGKYFWLFTRSGGHWQMSRVMLSLDEGDEAVDEWPLQIVE